MAKEKVKTFRAMVSIADGRKVDVEYPANADQPTAAAIKAAAKQLGVSGFAQEPTVEHNRDEVADGNG